EQVETSRAVLLDLDGKQEQSNTEQNLVKRLKNVLIPADDLLVEFAIQEKINELHRNKLKKVLHPYSLKNLDMANEIEKIQKKIDDVEKYMFGLNLNPNVGVVEKTNSEWRETGSYMPESEIIGRDDDKKKIVNLLRQPHGDRNVSFVAIVGMGGLGKTTLAQIIYSDKEVTNLFEKSM
ncbi:NBS-LRR resistance protein, partial [Trifolium medium]|nr:NBS-LRR resistance protein [Trifolium medium]